MGKQTEFDHGRALLVLTTAVAVAFGHAVAHAGEAKDFSFLLENDVLGGKTDRWYTNGARLSWASAGEPEWAPARAMNQVGRWASDGSTMPRLSYAIGQTMYSPENIKEAAPQPNDRPWGGFLYFAAGANLPAADRNSFQRVEAKLGVTGRYAYTEQAQKAVHRYLTDSGRPEGWHNQLKERVGLQLTYSLARRLGDEIAARDWFAFQYGGGVSAGNLRVNANLNFGVMFGNLIGPNSPLSMGYEGDFVSPDFSDRQQLRHFFGFAMAGVTGVAYNYFIEGDTPYGKSNLSVRPSFASAQFGLSTPLGETEHMRYRLVFALNIRQAEFDRRIDGSRGGTTRFGGVELFFENK